MVNTAVFRLPEELRMDPNWSVLEIGCGCGDVARVLGERAALVKPPVAVDVGASVLAAIGGGISPAAAQLDALPFADSRFNLAISAHGVHGMTDRELKASLSEARRVLKPGGLLLLWEFAPTRSALLNDWNRWLLGLSCAGGGAVRLRSFGKLRDLGYESGFDWVQPASLRPFLFPPIPRVSTIMGRVPEGWRSAIVDGQRVIEHIALPDDAASSLDDSV